MNAILRHTALWITMLLPVFQAFAEELHFHVFQDASYNGGIHSIAKDSVGRIWFSGADAVFMYDGSRFVKQNELMTCQNPSNYWSYGHLAINGKGHLFVATNRGLQEFDYRTQTFSAVMTGNIGPIEVTKDGTLWFIRNGSVYSLDVQGENRIYPLPPEENPDPNHLTVMCSGDSVWVAASRRLLRLDGRSGEYGFFAELPDEIVDLVQLDGSLFVLTQSQGLFQFGFDGIRARTFRFPGEHGATSNAKQLFEDGKGNIWVATQQGLMTVTPASATVSLIRANPVRSWSLPNNSIWSIYRDPDGEVWIGTYGGQLVIATTDDSDADYFKATQGGLYHPIVSCFAEDPGGNLWIGTEGGGISYWDRKTDEFTYYIQQGPEGLNSNLIKNLGWSDGMLTVSMFNGGVQEFNPRTGRFKDISITGNSSRNVYVNEKEGNRGIWLSDPDANLLYGDLSTGTATAAEFMDMDGRSIRLRCEDLFHDADGALWILSRRGLYKTDPSSRRILQHYYYPDAAYANNNLSCFWRNHEGDIWAGTRGGGLNHLSAEGKWSNLSERSGISLESRNILCIEADGNVLWMSTDDGLYCYDTAADSLWKSSVNVPSQCGAYYVRSGFRTSKGELLFGGTDGFILFNPKQLRNSEHKPRVFFVDLQINDRSCSPADLFAAQDKPVKLSHKQSNIGIRFAADSYHNSENNHFAYRMIGISDAWSDIPPRQTEIHFFDLTPGRYRFEVKAANRDGVWGDDVSALEFAISPSPFLTWWAKLLYVLLIAGIVYMVIRYSIDRKLFDNQQKLTKARINFFTNISHDLKTPLSLVVDPLKQLRKQVMAGSEAETYASMIEQNVSRIQRMISQLLMFRQIESQKIAPDSKPGELVSFLKNLFELFRPYAERKDFKMHFAAEPEVWHTQFDHDMVEKIFTNLLSNAVKYTPDGGEIWMDFRGDGANVNVSVINTEDDLNPDISSRIFEAFEHGSGRGSDFESSTGLGLAIVKELVEALDGFIKVDSAGGTVDFSVQLPMKPGKAEDATVEPQFKFTAGEIKDLLSDLKDKDEPQGRKARKSHSVVIIDDNDDLRRYLEMHLSRKYNVYSADDGVSGVQKVRKNMPQVVITDLKMSQMDGYQVCRILRSDEKTAHVPIIALSGSTQEKASALDAGANLFMEKPFDMAHLLSQIEVLIRTEDEYRRHYSKQYIVDPGKEEVPDADTELLARAMSYIEENMDNSDYDVDEFVSDMGIGRTVLYQKIKNVTGMPVKEFILDIRLRRAAQLLKDSDLTISEIAYRTGFSNPKYFSVCFKRRFDKTPSEHRG